MEIRILKFEDFSADLIYKVMKLRFDTFVLEQNSIYPEFDDIDSKAFHLVLMDDTNLYAYLRIWEKESGVASFGRVVVNSKYRKNGYGREIVSKALEYIKENMNCERVDIEAQEYLKSFYSSFGFVQTSQPFDDCGVLHIQMQKLLK